jgi:hypothetical protein
MTVMTVIVETTVEADDEIVMRFWVPSGEALALEMTADQAREFSNHLGAAILAASAEREVLT